jgi:hypothetical protein
MGCSFSNLERVQRLMSTKSTSDYSTSRSTGDKLDVADASGCLSYINTNYHDDDKPVMQIAVDCYVYNRDRAHLHRHLVQLAMTAYKTPKMGQKYANKMAQIVGDEIMGKTKNDSEKAKELGVDKSVYSRCHAPVFDIVYDGVFVPVSKADSLAGRYWRECKLT